MSVATNEAGLGVLLITAAFVISCLALLVIVRSCRFIFLTEEGRCERTWYIARVAVVRTIVSAFATFALVFAGSYWKDARLRASITPADCDTAQSANGRFIAQTCYVGDKVILRLDELGNRHPLAERTYPRYSDDPIRIYWKTAALLYEDGDDIGTIGLPPSTLDRLLARLP
jgi:hypothetical protein